MIESNVQIPTAKTPQEFPWLDVAVVIGITAFTLMLSAHFELNEALYSLTRRWEHFQVDELPLGMLVLSICLIWLSWRRYQHARRELRARRIAEARLAHVLVENRKLTQENLRIQEVERKHLARELHDELGQYLNAIKLDAVSICESGASNSEFSTSASLAIIRSVDHVHATVSGMIGRLRPAGLDELGLAAAIEHCVDQWRQRLPEIHFVLSIEGTFDDLSESLTLTVYRLIQEGLTNVYKHAGAGRVAVTLIRGEAATSGTDDLRLTVADDGCGMETSARISRFGLSGMRERVEMAGGTFSLESAPGRGLKFEARLPAHGSCNG
jgi:two-component system sensor histidine kinase UhpB